MLPVCKQELVSIEYTCRSVCMNKIWYTGHANTSTACCVMFYFLARLISLITLYTFCAHTTKQLRMSMRRDHFSLVSLHTFTYTKRLVITTRILSERVLAFPISKTCTLLVPSNKTYTHTYDTLQVRIAYHYQSYTDTKHFIREHVVSATQH